MIVSVSIKLSEMKYVCLWVSVRSWYISQSDKLKGIISMHVLLLLGATQLLPVFQRRRLSKETQEHSASWNMWE